MKRTALSEIVVCKAALCVLLGGCAQTWGGEPLQQQVQFKEGKAGELTELPLPAPEEFRTTDGKTGWKVTIPGGRPLATPAVSDGLLFVGGGFGGHEFYALDAKTGKRVWSFKTGDDGPTAAVVAEGCVAYNTESCTLYIHEARTGKVLWHRWLGDPLMSQPAIDNGRIFMSYPGEGGHHLVCFELRTGKVFWDQKIAAEVITAPVVAGDSLYAATCDGTLYHFDAANGKLHWSRQANVTCAPLIVNGKPYFSQRQEKEINVPFVGEGPQALRQVMQTYEGINFAASDGAVTNAPANPTAASFLLNPDKADKQLNANSALKVASQTAARGSVRDVLAALESYGKMPSESVNATKEQNPKREQQLAALSARLREYKARSVSKDTAGSKEDARVARQLSDDIESFVKGDGELKGDSANGRETVLKSLAAFRGEADKTHSAAVVEEAIRKTINAKKKEDAAAQQHDASVAFATAPDAAQLQTANANFGQSNVKSVWAFQGSRPLQYKDLLLTVQGYQLRAMRRSDDKLVYESRLPIKTDATRPATPPVLAGNRVYVATVDGHVICLDPASGKTAWDAEVGGEILFQPTVVKGRVYVATNDGKLICLETGDAKSDGWTQWGGSAKHNGPEER